MADGVVEQTLLLGIGAAGETEVASQLVPKRAHRAETDWEAAVGGR